MEDSESSHRELVYRKMTYELTDSMAKYVCHSVGQYSVCLLLTNQQHLQTVLPQITEESIT